MGGKVKDWNYPAPFVYFHYSFRPFPYVDVTLKFPLRDLLQGAITGNYSRQQLAELHRLSYTIAFRSVQRKIFSGRLRVDFFGMSEQDIATDCIAEMFRRTEKNSLAVICEYFQAHGVSVDAQSEDLLLVHLRKLIFTTVNDNLFRLYNELDPALGKILRNVKIAVEKSGQFTIVDRFDEHFLLLTSCDQLAHLPTMGDDELMDQVHRILTTVDEIPRVLQQLAVVLSSQDTFQRKIKLMTLAVAIKVGFQNVAVPAEHNDPSETVGLLDDVRTVIREVCRELSGEMIGRYVGNGKLTEKTFVCYMRAMGQVLLADFVEIGDGPPSYYEALQCQFPGLTRTAYMENHRTVFEYLVRIAKERVRERVKSM